jgi:hypothetical protein
VAVGPDMRSFTVEEALLHETEAAAEELFSAMEEGRRWKKLRMEGGESRQGLIGSHAAHEGGVGTYGARDRQRRGCRAAWGSVHGVETGEGRAWTTGWVADGCHGRAGLGRAHIYI